MLGATGHADSVGLSVVWDFLVSILGESAHRGIKDDSCNFSISCLC